MAALGALAVMLPPLLLGGTAQQLAGSHRQAGLDRSPRQPQGRQLQEEGCGAGGSRSLLWRVSKGGSGWTAYITGSADVAAEAALPSSAEDSAVMKVLDCADAAYFQMACAASDMGQFFTHCQVYPLSEPEDNVATRLGRQVTPLQSAIRKAADALPRDAARQLQASAEALGNKGNRTTLLAFYAEALRLLDPLRGRPGGLAVGDDRSYEDYLRETFGSTRPTFGLEDPDTRCKPYRGNTMGQDIELARKMSDHFSDSRWVADVMQIYRNLSRAIRCGDLGTLSDSAELLLDVSGRRASELGTLNSVLMNGIVSSSQHHPDENVFVAIDMVHLVDVANAKSVLELLKEAGYTIERVIEAPQIQCTRSTTRAMGAKELGNCLMPPQEVQEPSCGEFRTKFKEAVAGDPMVGRTKSDPCEACAASEEACECAIVWHNTENFTQLCHDTYVTGEGGGRVHGQVVLISHTRNPGSTRKGTFTARKTLHNRTQFCAAESCKLGLMEERFSRRWYQADASLVDLSVTMQPIERSPSQPFGLDFLSGWEWILPLAAILLVLLLVALILLPKLLRRGRKQSWRRSQRHAPNHVPLRQGPAQGGWNTRDIDLDSAHDVRLHDPVRDYGRPPSSLLRSPSPAHVRARSDSDDRGPPMKVYDSSLLTHAMQMQQELGDAGTQAVQQLQMNALMGLQSTAGLPTQALPSMPDMRGMPSMAEPPPMANLPFARNMPVTQNLSPSHFGGAPPGTRMGTYGGPGPMPQQPPSMYSPYM